MFKKLCLCESTHTPGRQRTERREPEGVGQGEVMRVAAVLLGTIPGWGGWVAVFPDLKMERKYTSK